MSYQTIISISTELKSFITVPNSAHHHQDLYSARALQTYHVTNVNCQPRYHVDITLLANHEAEHQLYEFMK